MKLSEYLIAKKLTSKKFAKSMRVSASSINKYRIGYRQPSLKRALKIEKATNGRVSVRDWH